MSVDLFARLRRVEVSPGDFFLQWNGGEYVWTFLVSDVGKALIEALNCGELDAPACKALRSKVEDATSSSGSANEARHVGICIVKWLNAKGHKLIGPDPITEPIERLIAAIDAQASESTARPTAAQVDGPIPPDMFRWKDNETKVQPLPLRLIKFLWEKKKKKALESEVVEHVWGNEDATKDAIASAVHKANKALSDVGYSQSISVKNGHLTLS